MLMWIDILQSAKDQSAPFSLSKSNVPVTQNNNHSLGNSERDRTEAASGQS